ncbi:hypothetical protein ILP97_58955 [Amycolatopsis sp. H6(2020)]|nr:hypothetical protein [Amycolatopsis sp. H6(2020)]
MIDLADALDWLARGGTVIGLGSWVVVFLRHRILRRRVHRFFGGRVVEVFLPLRTLEGRPAVVEPDFQTGLLLQQLLTRSGVRPSFRFLSAQQAPSFEADGAVVVCGPKNNAAVRRRLAAEPRVRFEQDGRRWLLRTVGAERPAGYRSPKDRDDAVAVNADIGYLGRTVEGGSAARRVPVLWIAGIHAEGSVAVADWLAGRGSLRRLGAQARRGEFSAIISGRYSDAPLRVMGSELVVLVGQPPRSGRS